MCGIVGIWHRRQNAEVDANTLQSMNACLKHRGPDDSGLYINREIGLAHRRLSIIDLSSAGHQPMTTPDGRFTIAFNGEIYNFRNLQKKYLSNLPLKSKSDTEVLLHLLASRGISTLPLLRGMYALALWDNEEKQLTLARDPFGKKPLYYADLNGTLIFASEIKALLKYPQLTGELDPVAITKYFLYEYAPAPASGYQNIHQVPIGSYLQVIPDHASCIRYWQPQFLPKSRPQNTAAQLDKLLSVAVTRRLVSDVPVGLFLSGGMDSTTIGWYMRQNTREPIHSFSVSFEENSSFDESSYAKLAADKLGLEHHTLDFTLDTFRQTIEEIAPLIDIPFADASLLPTYAISKLARRHITVALDGDGSDELFAGYGTFTAAQVANYLRFLPEPVIKKLQTAASKIPTQYRDFSFDFKVKAFFKGLSYDLPQCNQIWLGSFSDRELHHLLTPKWQNHIPEIFSDIDKLHPRIKALPLLDKISLLTTLHYLHNGILVKLDRATMFTGLEARTPFLDVDLVNFITLLPTSAKKDKQLLKQVMRGRIPDQIINRPKKGFGIPLGLWLRGPLHGWAKDILNPSKLRQHNILNPGEVNRLLAQHRAGRADHRKKLWTLLSFQLWLDNWIIKH